MHIDDIPDCDLVTYGFPCQDISIAGKQKGIIHGETRSGLLYEALRIIEFKKPKYAIAENVKNLVGTRYKEDFDSLLKYLDGLGYNNYWQVLNAKDYGIPQNRERVFVISIRKDIDNGGFKFPKPFDSEPSLECLLDKGVDDKYYLGDKNTDKILNDLKGRLPNQRISYCIDANYHKGTSVKQFVKKRRRQLIQESNRTNSILEPDAQLPILRNIYGGFKEKEPRIFNKYSPTVRTSAGGGHIPSVCTTDKNKVEKEVSGYKIRKLTPLECWRLMGFDDEDYWKARRALEKEHYNGRDRSNTQMYKQAGNSIVVNVLEEIYKNLFKDYIN